LHQVTGLHRADIESNDYKRLPGGIFNRSFVKAYARYVGYDEKEAVEGYSRYMRDSGDSGEEVVTTPYHSKVYTDAPATRSPLLTVVLAILILAVLTAVALSVLHWVQRRSAIREVPNAALLHDKVRIGNFKTIPRNVVRDLKLRKADYEQFLQ
jgi:cytoskeletal protein RodZ